MQSTPTKKQKHRGKPLQMMIEQRKKECLSHQVFADTDSDDDEPMAKKDFRIATIHRTGSSDESDHQDAASGTMTTDEPEDGEIQSDTDQAMDLSQPREPTVSPENQTAPEHTAVPRGVTQSGDTEVTTVAPVDSSILHKIMEGKLQSPGTNSGSWNDIAGWIFMIGLVCMDHILLNLLTVIDSGPSGINNYSWQEKHRSMTTIGRGFVFITSHHKADQGASRKDVARMDHSPSREGRCH